MQMIGDVHPLFDIAPLSSNNPKEFRSAREYAYSVIRDLIAGMSIAPGTLLTEKSVSELLKVSATPIREAFVKLREEGLVIVYPQRGTYVSKIDKERTANARWMRKTLERELIACLRLPVPPFIAMEMRLILEKQDFRLGHADHPNAPYEFVTLDNAFHRQLFVAAGRTGVWDMLQQFSFPFDRVRVLSFQTQRIGETLLDEHRAILRAAEGESRRALSEAWSAHHKSIGANYHRSVEEYPDYFV